ncbi:hypothetical protein [Methylobacterium sp. J-068]|uniref:hypothetical protein n=1 Tax=Methylobacterium sp. J-068 TaxID=2836649 RepID=UPI001FBC06C5|nr:hypothetical protein [Methylobacterium sp. J-068]MCJ2035665.1 hypothetical protein [Methylobacterium sp. J-068]
MKTFTYALLFMGALAVPQAAMAASKTTVGVGTGAVAGALVGGPVGAVVGGIVGGYIGATAESPRPRRRRVRAARRAAVAPPRKLRVAEDTARPVPAATGSLAPAKSAPASPKPAPTSSATTSPATSSPVTTWQNPR